MGAPPAHDRSLTVPAPGQTVTGSLSGRIHHFLVHYHQDAGHTPREVATVLPPPEGFDPSKWMQTVSNQLAREARNGTLVKEVNGREVRYRRVSPVLSADERRNAARDRLRGVGVTVTTERVFPPDTWEAAAGVFVAAADRED